jgi:pyruvate formate lyase activating enzyme
MGAMVLLNMTMKTVTELLNEFTVPAELVEKQEDQRVRCLSCAHQCSIPDGESGICKMHVNRGGELRTPFGYVSGAQTDPIEKKPFFHVLPAARAYSYGTLGCNFHCEYCQNWTISQTHLDPHFFSSSMKTSPQNLVEQALIQDADVIVSTYNEPLIANEWNAAVFKEAKAAGLLTGYVSNGFASAEALEYLHPWLDLFKVDLKSFDDAHYRQLGGRLQPVLDAIHNLHKMGIWVEIVTLLVPGFNDSPTELTQMTEFLAGISVDIPWHVTAFHADYKMTGVFNTTSGELFQAAQIGKRSGLRYVYAGNLPGRLQSWENTYCPGCGALLVERIGFHVQQYCLKESGSCPSCGIQIPGRWT